MCHAAVAKSFRDCKPLTEVSLTQAGRSAFVKYLDSLGKLVG